MHLLFCKLVALTSCFKESVLITVNCRKTSADKNNLKIKLTISLLLVQKYLEARVLNRVALKQHCANISQVYSF